MGKRRKVCLERDLAVPNTENEPKDVGKELQLVLPSAVASGQNYMKGIYHTPGSAVSRSVRQEPRSRNDRDVNLCASPLHLPSSTISLHRVDPLVVRREPYTPTLPKKRRASSLKRPLLASSSPPRRLAPPGPRPYSRIPSYFGLRASRAISLRTSGSDLSPSRP